MDQLTTGSDEVSRPNLDAQAYWQRLRKDGASNLASGALLLAAIVTTLAVLDVLLTPARDTDRSNPLYWAILLPVAWWGTAISSFSPWAARTMRPAAVVIPLVCVAILFVVIRSGGAFVLTLVALLIAVAGSGICLLFLPRSLLQREGPDRR